MHRGLLTLDTYEFTGTEHRRVFDQPGSGFTEHDTAGRSDGFHPLSHADLFADGGVTHWGGVKFTRNHLSGVESYPELQHDVIMAFEFVGQSLRL